jgi:hypothetical protein
MFLKLEAGYFKGFSLYAGVSTKDGIGIYIAKRIVVKSPYGPYMVINPSLTFGNDTQSDSLKQTLQFSEDSEYPDFENKV